MIRPRIAVLAACLFAAGAAFAQTTVQEAWVRATLPQQKATGMFARITAPQGGRLVSAASPAAAVVEIHEMAMDGDVMRMRALPDGLALPAGKPVELKPGGHHVMLMDLKQPLAAGQTVPVTLVFEGAGGQRDRVELQVPVKAANAAPAKHAGH